VDLRKTDLRKLNSATKYPSIPTFHVLGERGRLREEVQVSFGDVDVVVTEKLDGTNTRIIVLDDGSYLIGSREELLHARGDIVFNPAQGIVAAVCTIADRVADALAGSGQVVTFYGEVYGGKTSGSKAYGTSVGFRLFDVVRTPVRELDDHLELSAEEIAHWRDSGGQTFVDESEITKHAALAGVDVTPRLEAKSPPAELRETHAWLKAVLPGDTLAPLNDDRKGRPEGVVVRTRDRRVIAKLRFEDYERTLR
jgi:hypothetical protein